MSEPYLKRIRENCSDARHIVVEGLDNKAKVAVRKSYGFRTYALLRAGARTTKCRQADLF